MSIPRLPADWAFAELTTNEDGGGLSSAAEIWNDARGLIIARDDSAENPTFRLRFFDLLSVDILPDMQMVIGGPAARAMSQTTFDHLLADQVTPRIIAHEGRLVLHAGAVQYGAGSILMMGDTGLGKSTLVASLDQAGLPLLGDDAFVISFANKHALAQSIYPSLRLLPDSLAAIFNGAMSTRPVAHYTEKRRIDVPLGTEISTAPTRISALFVLNDPPLDETIRVQPMRPVDVCMALVTNSFALDPTDLERATRKLEQAAALASSVPAFCLSYPRDYARLPEVRAAILAQVVALEVA